MKLSALRYLWAQVLSLPSTPPSHPPSRFLTLLRAAQIWIKELTQDLDHRAERQKDLEAQLQALQPASHQSTRALTRIQQHAGVQQLSLSLSRSVSGWVGGWVGLCLCIWLTVGPTAQAGYCQLRAQAIRWCRRLQQQRRRRRRRLCWRRRRTQIGPGLDSLTSFQMNQCCIRIDFADSISTI